MIVLNTSKELVRVESWSDIIARPAFTQNVAANDTLKEIIGSYAFLEEVPCGLKSCQEGHKRGYLVATNDGKETNLGNVCGKNRFGVDFVTLTRKFDNDLRNKERREALWSFYRRLEEVADQVNALRRGDRGGDWVYNHIRKLVEISKGLPQEIVTRVQAMVKARDGSITSVRVATETEHERMEVEQRRTLDRPQYVSEKVAEIHGIDALYPENDLRTLLVLDLEEGIRQFRGVLDIDALTTTELVKWSKWVGSVDVTIARATDAIEAGRRLLRVENLRPLGEFARLGDERRAFDAFLRSIA